ncbi:MAG TPA: MFS transporter [Mycobacteriales bacterium]|nr:MFS transporter [Mycobacteriales bacterium]
MTTTSARASAVSAGAGLVLFASVVAVGLQLRPAVATVPPLLDVLRERNGFGLGGAILLTTLPVVCFGLAAALAPPVDRRWGAERGILWCLLLLGGGLLFRAVVGGVPALLAGTVVAAGAVGVLHVLLPALFKRRAPDAVAALTTAMSVTIGVGAAVSASLAVPIWHELSLGLSLGLWGAVALAVAVLWLPQARSRTVTAPTTAAGVSLYRDGLAWQVTLYFGLQSVAYYALLSWLPTYFLERDLGRTAAGAALAVLALAGVGGSLLAKPLGARLADQRPAAAVGGVAGLTGLAGMLLLPDVLALGSVALLGMGLGMALNTSLLLTTLRAGDPSTAARLSGMAQTVGYLMAALGPFAFGVLRGVTGGWTVPMMLLGLVLVGDVLAGLAAGRARTVGRAD